MGGSQKGLGEVQNVGDRGHKITNGSSGYQILGIDIEEYIRPGQPVEAIVEEVHRQGGIAIAPYPHRGPVDGTHQLMHLWDNYERYAHMFGAWGVANRGDLFNVLGLKKSNYMANSDFHERRRLYSRETLLPCKKNLEATYAEIPSNEGFSFSLFREGKRPQG